MALDEPRPERPVERAAVLRQKADVGERVAEGVGLPKAKVGGRQAEEQPQMNPLDPLAERSKVLGARRERLAELLGRLLIDARRAQLVAELPNGGFDQIDGQLGAGEPRQGGGVGELVTAIVTPLGIQRGLPVERGDPPAHRERRADRRIEGSGRGRFRWCGAWPRARRIGHAATPAPNALSGLESTCRSDLAAHGLKDLRE